MGTKRQLASHVTGLVEKCQDGPLLDLFSGMCAVAAAAGRERQIWTNDCQHFAWSVAESYFCSLSPPLNPTHAIELTGRRYAKHHDFLETFCLHELREERRALDERDVSALATLATNASRSITRTLKSATSHDLFVTTYAGSYFSVSQCLEIDAIKYAIDDILLEEGIDEQQHRWLMLGLCKALSRCASTTGHFAQPLVPNHRSIDRYVRQRVRSIWEEWVRSLSALTPQGGRAWRQKNLARRGEALEMLTQLKDKPKRPGVIYADPPYTADHYSRYYHIYETLLLYDYPPVAGKGRYRQDRHVSSFSLSSRVKSSVEEMIASAAMLGSDLILSYPTNGLMEGSRDLVPELIRRHYGRDPDVHELTHEHSTMGASKGAVRSTVTEVLYCARH